MFPNDLDGALRDQSSVSERLWESALRPWSSGILPDPQAIEASRESIHRSLPVQGLGLEATRTHILRDIVPGLNANSLSPNYYGFVTGGVTPAALFADQVVSTYDQNVQVHLSEHSICTDVEYHALGLLLDLLGFDRATWHNGTFTTGATGSNIMGLACGREFVLQRAAQRQGASITSVGESGFLEVMLAAGLKGIQVLSTLPHSSLGKAAGILGIGRHNVKSICTSPDNLLEIDMQFLEKELSRSDRASIVAVSCGEVNTGHFATRGTLQMTQLRQLCDRYGAWLHVDGAFGLFGRILDASTTEYATVRKGSEGLELADSITGDAHKFLNVPYDCGFFLCRHPSAELANNVFQNANAAYLSAGKSSQAVIPSPLNIGIENSRRFRALPVYASLLAYGKSSYRELLEKQIQLARRIANWLFDHSGYTPLPVMSLGSYEESKKALIDNVFTIVLFRANDEVANRDLTSRINKTRKMFVSGTSWDGKPACRIAVSNWRVDVEKDFSLVIEVLGKCLQ